MFKRSDNKRLSVHVRGGFADRNNIHPENTMIQYDDLDRRSRVAIVNAINVTFHAVFDRYYNSIDKKSRFWGRVLRDVYIMQTDYSYGVSYNDDKMFEIINKSIYEEDYANVLSVVEAIAQYMQKEDNPNQNGVYQMLNQVFEKEFVGYRFINGQISRITSEIEIDQIEEAIKCKKNKVDEHISKALELLSRRDNPDYENSIKESISAVEALCNSITGKQATLGDALKIIKKENSIHPCMETAFEKLYGYSCDASGIRHSGQMDGPNATFEEAKFMLVACSGFVNYLKGVYSKK